MNPDLYRDMAMLQEQHWWFSTRRKILSRLIQSLALPPDATILEIGCGTGSNLAMLAQFGQLHALESHSEAREFSESLNVCHVLAGRLPDQIPFEGPQFDLICLLDVLEHIEDDVTALARSGRLLKPGGRILVTVPAYQWLWSSHDEMHQHYRRYTTELLATTVGLSGLQMVQLSYFNTLLFPAIALTRLAGVWLKSRSGHDAKMPWRWLNALLENIFSLEQYFVTWCRIPFGTSVMAVISAKPRLANTLAV